LAFEPHGSIAMADLLLRDLLFEKFRIFDVQVLMILAA